MPELPEVETTVRCMQSEFLGYKICNAKFYRKNLRDPMPISRIKKESIGKHMDEITRRGKYILIHTGDQSLVLHLGMTGNVLSLDSKTPAQKHTHFVLELEHPKTKKIKYMHYVDPRRFGRLDLLSKDSWQDHKYFSAMGPEPLDIRALGKHLYDRSTGKKTTLKSFVMDQRTVVGVGNIYACEALFLTGLHPTTPAGEVSIEDYGLLAKNIKLVLRRAIKQGGTSFRDFKHLDGKAGGYFRIKLNVYDRQGEDCKQCESAIENLVIAGRSSFYCPSCQET